jgi:hypothetical protein
MRRGDIPFYVGLIAMIALFQASPLVLILAGIAVVWLVQDSLRARKRAARDRVVATPGSPEGGP